MCGVDSEHICTSFNQQSSAFLAISTHTYCSANAQPATAIPCGVWQA